jgi:uncharacterized membrane protein YgcG
MGLRKWIRSRFGKSTPEPSQELEGGPSSTAGRKRVSARALRQYDGRSIGVYRPNASNPAQIPQHSEPDLLDDALNVGIGIAIGEALSNDASSSDSSDTSPSSDDYSGGGGDFGGGGASGDW